MSDTQWVSLRHEVERLTAECQTLQVAGQRLEQQRDDLAQENGRLQSQLLELALHAAARPQQAMPTQLSAAHRGNAARALKKLHYQLARLTARSKPRSGRSVGCRASLRRPLSPAGRLSSRRQYRTVSPGRRAIPSAGLYRGRQSRLLVVWTKPRRTMPISSRSWAGTVCGTMARGVTKSWLRSSSKPISCSARLTATVIAPSPRLKSSVGRCKSPVISCADRASPICGPSS